MWCVGGVDGLVSKVTFKQRHERSKGFGPVGMWRVRGEEKAFIHIQEPRQRT